MRYAGYALDPFQEKACRAIDDGLSVIVAAPTGAGKTVIAEYATERCRRRGRRVIYTAPIKALSNQKFRDFRAKFGDDVGIVTGDVVLNARAPVTVMTTEILRNTIFEDLSELDDVEYVVFDEIHYINDIERGTVWEESIIFAPQTIRFACLSATMPNLDQFAAWIQSVRDIELTVISEEHRPVPLEHRVFMPGWGLGDVERLKRVNTILHEQENGDAEDEQKPKRRRAQTLDPTELVEHLVRDFRLPALYFCFSRRGCEDRARYFAAQGSFLSPQGSGEILDAYDSLCAAFDLQDDVRAQEFREIIESGIAYHHAGMLPTLKEVVERLFTLGKIQLLFTTETFAVGINMPARSVVFESLEKYDGISFRYLKAREYQQMAGRAGRRGIDDRGFVYALVDPETVQIPSVEHILTGEPEPIESQFNLSYSSILNLLDEYGDMMFEVCRKSFGNFQSTHRIQALRRKIRDLEKRREQLEEPKCLFGHNAMEVLTAYRNISQEVQSKLTQLRPARTRVKRKFSGRRKKRERVKRLAQLNRQEATIKRDLDQSPCHGCRNLNPCQKRFSALYRAEQKTAGLRNEIHRIENYQREQIERRLKVLGALGYIEGYRVLPRGQIAQQIYGYELQVTQLVFDGFFERLDPDTINVLAVAMVFESKRDEWYRKIEDPHLVGLLRAAEKQIDHVRKLEMDFGVDTLTHTLDPKLSSATLAWSRGCEFDELQKHTSSPEGDLVRVFRSAADLLRQMRRALKDHPRLPERFLTAIKRLNRDIVDAERQLRTDLTPPDTATSNAPVAPAADHENA